MNMQTLLLLAPPILLALTFHEYAHAFVANIQIAKLLFARNQPIYGTN